LAVEKRVRFKSWWLPWALVAPQLAIVLVFFFWPAGQALFQSVLREDAFGTSSEYVGLENFKALFADDTYLASFRTTAVFSVLVAGIGLTVSMALAVMADRVVKGAAVYKTLMIWPYAVAPVVAGVLWLFMFAPCLVEAAAIDGAGPWRRFWTVQFPLLTPTTFFLLVINIIYVFIDTFAIVDAATSGGPGKETAILVYKVYFDGFKAMDLGGSAAQSVVLMLILVALTVVQFRYVERRVNY